MCAVLTCTCATHGMMMIVLQYLLIVRMAFHSVENLVISIGGSDVTPVCEEARCRRTRHPVRVPQRRQLRAQGRAHVASHAKSVLTCAVDVVHKEGARNSNY